MLRKMVPIAKLVHENCDSIALGTRIRNILQEYEENEVLKPFDIHEKKKTHQMQLFRAA